MNRRKFFRFSKTGLNYCLITLALFEFISTPLSWSQPKKIQPKTIYLGEGIRIGELLIEFESVKISPVYERKGGYFVKSAENYKFVIVTAGGKNIGKRRDTLQGQGFEIEVDKGYFYSPILLESILGFDLLPEETGKAWVVFQILKNTKPVKLHFNIIGKEFGKVKRIEFVVILDETKFVYPKGAEISIENYEISYEYKKAIVLDDKLIQPAGYEIYHIDPVVKNSGDLPITVNFEVEISGFKEIGRRNAYTVPSNSTITLRPSFPVPPWYWQNLKNGMYPRIPGGEHSLKVIIKDEAGKIIDEKIFTILIK